MQQKGFGERVFCPEDDNGYDFERFVLEALSGDDARCGLVRRLGRGRDGAIDMVSENDGETTIVECKYVGDQSYKTARARWREVQARLSEHLPKLAAQAEASPSSPYRFWLDLDRPVRRYVFCASALMTNLEARSLGREIQAFFAGLASEPGLAVLAGLGAAPDAIEVKSWDDLETSLNAHPALRYRWFGGLPYGARLLESERAQSKGFHRFLHETTLPFFPRSEFMAETGLSGLASEDQILEKLEGDQPAAALIVAGPGGVGKTRLCLELGRRLQDRGWLVVGLTRGADDDTIRSVLQAHHESIRAAFILDYAEATRALDRIAEAVREGGEGGGHRVRLLASCRASAMRTVEDAFVDLHRPDPVRLASGGLEEDRYTTWVTRRILEHGGLPDVENIARVCGATPALAAFATFLHSTDRDRFDAQFSGLHETTDFHTWAQRRIDAITGAGTASDADLRQLADLALSLPLALDQRDVLIDGGGRVADLLGSLELDHWLEPDSGTLVAAHDVLTDSIAARWLLDAPGAATTRVTDALRRAANAWNLEAALGVLDRLAVHPSFGELDGAEAVRRLFQVNEEAVLGAAHALLSGLLLDQEAKIRLLNDLPSLRDTVAANRALDGPVSALAEHAAQLPPEHPLRSLAMILKPLLDLAVVHPHPSNIMLRRAYTLFPDHYRSAVRTRIDAEPTASDTHFLLVRMLRSGEPPDALWHRLERWLDNRGATDVKASFIYKSWLDAGGEVEPIREQALAWLATHGGLPEARFVYKSWLDAGGGVELIREQVFAWLANHGGLPEAEFVYTSWLDNGGGIEPVREQALAWLATHSRLPEASFVYKGWLNAGGEFEPIREQALGWLATHGGHPEAQFVYKCWLDSKGEIDLVQDQVLAWFTTYGGLPEARFLYQGWLDAGGGVGLVQEQVLAWLSKHAVLQEASFVYKSWLDAGGGIEPVRDQTMAWLAKHGGLPEAEFVYRSWLEAYGPLEPIKAYLFAWLHAWRQDARAVFLTKAISQLDDLPDDVLVDLAVWAERNCEDEDAIFRVSRISRYLKYRSLSDGSFTAIRRAALAVLRACSRREMPDEDLYRMSVGILLTNLCICPNDPGPGALSTYALSSFVADGSVFRPGSELNSDPYLLHSVAAGLRAGMLDTSRDAAGLEQFVGWLRSLEDAEEAIAGFRVLLGDGFESVLGEDGRCPARS